VKQGIQYGILAFCGAVCILCTTIARAQKLPFTNYTTANGLTHNRTHVIRQDGMGYIWIGTDLGINRYDGRSFKYFPCPEKGYRSARYAIRNSAEVIFAIDHFGIAVCVGDSVRFIKLNTEKIGSINGVVCINDSTYYLNNESYGLYCIKNGITRQIILPEPFTRKSNFVDIFNDRKNNIWSLSPDGLLFFPNGDILHPVQIPFFEKTYINSVRQDKNGDIYVSSHLGVFRYSEDNCSAILSVKPEMVLTLGADISGITLPMGADISDLTFDEYDNIWMASTLKGLYKYNKNTKAVSNYGFINGLVSQNAWDVFCDKENNIWVATENGISKLTTQFYYSFDFTNTDYQNVKGACILNDSTLLFSTILDAYIFTNGKIEKINGYKNIVGYLEDLFLKITENKLFVNIYLVINATYIKILTYSYELKNNTLNQGKKLEELPGGIEHIYINHGAAHEGNEMWISTTNGLQLYKNGKFYPVPGFTENDKNITITYIARNNKGDLWFINNNRDLVRYKITPANADSFPYKLEQQQYIRSDRLGAQYYYKMFIDTRGYIWLCGKEKGICLLLTESNGNVTSIDTFASGTFSSDIINDVAEDNGHNIWIGTALGLDKVVFKKDSFRIEKDVYGSVLCGKYIFFVKKLNDKLFVGTTGCMGVISTDQHEPGIAPEVYVSGVKVNEKKVVYLPGSIPEFKPNENSISFTFTGISFKDEHHIKYSYKLDGLDKNWSDPRPEYTITYSRVPPGNYTFKVKALSANGIWSIQPATFTFTIAQPFYTQWWFIALVIITVYAIVYSVYRYRINQLLEIQKIRQSISKDLHDDIGATVSSINILANMAKSDLVSESKRNHFLETIQEESKHVTESLNDIVWNINPKNDSLDIMFARMQRYASELFEARNIVYEFALPQVFVGEQNMDMRQRQHVYLIFKEAVNNLIKYAEATRAVITLSIAKGTLTLIISDDGKGFDVNSEHTGNGIFNMKKRAQEITADLVIESAPNKGTTIQLSMPF